MKKSDKKYHVSISGYVGYSMLTGKELKEFLQAEIITARRDINSATWLWCKAIPYNGCCLTGLSGSSNGYMTDVGNKIYFQSLHYFSCIT